MISLKQHNDVVQKLIKELDSKEAELKLATKEKAKPSQAPQFEPSQNEKQLTSKINQLNKEYKDKISTLTQQLRGKSIENRELKERLTARSNLQAKEKDHIAEILKKNYDRKPSSAADYKISALISHYEAEVAKKTKFIENLQKQIRELENQSKTRPAQQDENCQECLTNEIQPAGVTLVQHQREVGRVKMEASKFKKLLEEKEKEYKDLSRRFGDLTNQYYRIINAYGLEETKPQSTLTKGKSSQDLARTKKGVQPKALQNLLQQMVDSEDSSMYSESSRQITAKPTHFTMKQEQQSEDQAPIKEDIASLRLQEVMALLKITDPAEIVPQFYKIRTQLDDYELADTVARSLQVFLYNIGKGRVTKQELVRALEDLEQAYSRNLEAVDLLDELCIEVGAKREKLNQRVQELLQTQSEYHRQLKSLKFAQEVARGNKVLEFIEFFELDRSELALPQQLVQMQEQLKSITKYVKEVRALLNLQPQRPTQAVLEIALRFLQKSTALIGQYERKARTKAQ